MNGESVCFAPQAHAINSFQFQLTTSITAVMPVSQANKRMNTCVAQSWKQENGRNK